MLHKSSLVLKCHFVKIYVTCAVDTRAFNKKCGSHEGLIRVTDSINQGPLFPKKILKIPSPKMFYSSFGLSATQATPSSN